jgi:hypothetical protein
MTEHRWSGWPGAFCLDCFAPDLREQSLADDCTRCDDGYPDRQPYHCPEHTNEPCPVATGKQC